MYKLLFTMELEFEMDLKTIQAMTMDAYPGYFVIKEEFKPETPLQFESILFQILNVETGDKKILSVTKKSNKAVTVHEYTS